MILLDTHVVVALRAGDAQVGKRARRAIEKAHLRNEVGVSAVSFWEVAMLVEARRLKLGVEPSVWRHTVLADGVVEVPLDGEIGIRATEILPTHADPADRMIVATAACADATLYTADGVLLDHALPVTAVDSTV